MTGKLCFIFQQCSRFYIIPSILCYFRVSYIHLHHHLRTQNITLSNCLLHLNHFYLFLLQSSTWNLQQNLSVSVLKSPPLIEVIWGQESLTSDLIQVFRIRVFLAKDRPISTAEDIEESDIFSKLVNLDQIWSLSDIKASIRVLHSTR